ncbi:G protein-coupled receptor, class C, group 5, member Bb [Esox lucius]|uniref:G-protein coupled receptors family 3 profile domain-containing protein n=1 Tax=Esox lucius TaxID=8010 RepID=A0A3P9AA58_ESOLU|nr:G protein-coupled receptor, class C, group 5, member Bb [Esox lucius]XP_010863847.1 G protein-coupled receptor, class C, group 5, member Bb [Esox lucius]
MALSPVLFFLLSLIGCGRSQDDIIDPGKAPPPPRGCGTNVDPLYRALCDLESVWTVVLEAVACGGAITSLVLFVVLLAKRRTVLDPDRRSGLGPLLLLLASLLALFSLSLAFMVARTEAVCVVRRVLWGPLFALCFSCLLAQAVRLKRLVSGKSSPKGGALAVLAGALALVQGIVSGEWLLLSVVRESHRACDYPPLDFALVCSYALGLLVAALGLSLGVVLCGGDGGEDEEGSDGGCERRWRCNGVWLFLACLVSLLLWAAWLVLYLHGDAALRRARSGGGARRQEWDEPVSAVALVAQGWVLLLFHAIPEAHLCLRDPPAPSQHDYFDTSQPPPPCFQQDMTITRGPYTENQAYSIEEHSAALRGGSFHNGGIRPGVPFRGHMYQPTEMALVMNGGTMPTAPVHYTGRQLW